MTDQRKRIAQLDTEQWIVDLVKDHLQSAVRGLYWGNGQTPYFASCRRQNPFRGITTIFTRDQGYHSSGWWKNPDYERCYHLSISFFDPATLSPRPADLQMCRQLVRAFFRKYSKWVWVEGPYSSTGRKLMVSHYRLFCDQAWQPIKPRGEVYSRELTEAGWVSYSDVEDAMAKTGVNPNR